MDFSKFDNKYLPPSFVDESFKYLKTVNKKYVFKSEIVGYSTKEQPIHLYKLGKGSIKVFLFSQIHGNEPTSTRGLLSLLNDLLKSSSNLLEQLNLYIMPQVNPDGALAYTRASSNLVDLNRDAINLTEPESKILRSVIDNSNFNYCLALHDQRTFHATDKKGLPTSLAVLAPPLKSQKLLSVRQQSMKIIIELKKHLTKQDLLTFARFRDEPTPGAFEEYCLSLGVPTILIEAGHIHGDYLRRGVVKKYHKALLQILETIATKNYIKNNADDYFKIPNNCPEYVDLIVRNLNFKNSQLKDINLMTLFFKEELKDGKVIFYPNVIQRQDWPNIRGHYEIDL